MRFWYRSLFSAISLVPRSSPYALHLISLLVLTSRPGHLFHPRLSTSYPQPVGALPPAPSNSLAALLHRQTLLGQCFRFLVALAYGGRVPASAMAHPNSGQSTRRPQPAIRSTTSVSCKKELEERSPYSLFCV